MNLFRKALIDVAFYYAQKFSYDFREDSSSFSWPDELTGKTNDEKELRLFQKPNTQENRRTNGCVCVRDRFTRPRIDIYGPERDWFVSIEVDSRTGEYKESQIFGHNGVLMFNEVYSKVMNEVEKYVPEMKKRAFNEITDSIYITQEKVSNLNRLKDISKEENDLEEIERLNAKIDRCVDKLEKLRNEKEKLE